MATYKPSEARYDAGGQVKWIVYQSPQPLRNGRVQERTRVKRLYFPGDATDIRLGKPEIVQKRTGRTVFGVPVRYRYKLAATRARRNGKTVEVPERWAERTKIVELPERAKAVKLTDKPPEGPRVAVA